MELLKLAGIGMVLASSFWVGLHAALRLRRTHEQLLSLQAVLELMQTEIGFAGTSFAPLCKRAEDAGGAAAVQSFFRMLAQKAEQPDLPSEGRTRSAAAEAGLVLPEPVMKTLERLFDQFGRFDREGQLRQLKLASAELVCLDEELRQSMEQRCRSYETLGLSAGAAILILVL